MQNIRLNLSDLSIIKNGKRTKYASWEDFFLAAVDYAYVSEKSLQCEDDEILNESSLTIN